MQPTLYAAQVYYLGGADLSSESSQQNPSYSLKQRIHDLLDFSIANQHKPDRSGRISGHFLQEIDYNEVSGNQSKSFLRSGIDYLSELHLSMQEKLPRDYRFEGEWFLRKTDNIRIEKRGDVRLKQINVKAYNRQNLFEFGDFYADLSQFVLGATLEGFNIVSSPSEGQEYTLIAARSQRADPAADKFQRNVVAVKGDWNLFKDSPFFSNFRVGIQSATVQDDSSTINRSANTTDLRNTTFSIDGEFSLHRYLTMAYELARSFYLADEDTSNDDTCGTALRLQPSLNLGKFQVRYLYGYVQPKFYTDLGSAATDKIQHQVTLDVALHKKLSMSLSENYHFDHLNGSSLTKRTLNDEKYFVLSARPFDGRPDFLFRPYMNYQVRSSDDDGNTAGAITRTVGFSINDVLDDHTSAGISYEYRGFTNTASRSSSDYFNRVGLNFAREQQLFKRRIYYSVDPSVDIRNTKTDNNKDVSITVGLNMQYDVSPRLVMRLGNTIADTNAAQPSDNYFNNRAFWEFDLLVDKDRSARLVLRGERNNYTSENGEQSYREQRAILKFLASF